MHPFLMFLLPMLVGIGFFFYFFFRRMCHTFQWTPLPKHPKLFLGLLAGIITVLSGLVFTPLGLVSVFLLYVFGFGLLMLGINKIVQLIGKEKYQNGMKPWKKLYGSGILTALLAIIMMIAGAINLNCVRKTEYTVQTDKNIREEGYRVVLLADTHYGVSLDREDLTELCEEINGQDPDLVILCGDLVDNNTTEQGMKELFSALGTLKSEFGTFFVYGNHDRSLESFGNQFSNEALAEEIQKNGITILLDETVQLTEDLVLVGREDRSREPRKSVEELLKSTDPSDFILMLDHQPNQYKEQGKNGTDLLLSGHTHGGQMFPLNLLMEIVPFNDGVYGTYSLGESGQAIVTSGVSGWSIPIKTAAPAEYVVIDIQGK